MAEKTAQYMPSTNTLVFHIMQELRKDPRPTCFPCLGVTSPEQWVSVRMQISSQYRQLYTFEDGICGKCHTKQENIRRLNLN